MNNKKIILLAMVLLLGVSSLTAANTKIIGPLNSTSATFKKGNMFVTPQVGFNRWSVPFGASFEYAVTGNIGVGASLVAYFWSGASVIVPTVDGTYHFTWLKVDKLDVYAGAAMGFAIYKSTLTLPGKSGLYFAPFTGARYWFSKKIAASLRVNFGLFGDYWNSPTGLAGVTFRF
jgi:hypothetical protein